MALTVGTRVASYEIVAPIGSGGMGEVYRARDARLGRDVAIKVLPEPLLRDAERLDGLEREARLLAALNHPNVATLYGLEDFEGQRFLIMELVEGETLAERIANGSVPVEEALPLFVQIADGLEAAHEKGIIHRDLKPANVKITPEGKAKVLDFGLAKALGAELASSVEGESPTVTRRGTETGVILGTAAYMSPEQARGKSVDKRTDVWAFGCCLYEALTGRPAFIGETVSDTLAAILKNEPDYERLPPGTPPDVRKLLPRLFHKESRWRLRDIGDARIELEEISKSPPDTASADETKGTPWRATALAAIVSALVLGGVALWSLSRPSARPVGAVTRTIVRLPAGAELARDTAAPDVAISPDGRHIAFVASDGDTNRLYIRSLDALEARPVDGGEGAVMPFFSPDGEWLGFNNGGSLLKVAVGGSAPVEIARAVEARGVSWGEDDAIVFTEGSTSGLFSMRSDGSGRTPLTTPDRERREKTHRLPEVLPGGAVAFTLGTPDMALWDEGSVAVFSPETGEHRVLIERGTNPRYSPTGHLVYVRDGALFAVRFDPESFETMGAPVRVVENISTYPLQGQAEYGLSRNGSLLYAAGSPWGTHRRVVWVDRTGRAEPLVETPRAYLQARISPDGATVALDVEGANRSLWIHDLERGTSTRLSMAFDSMHPAWSPEGDLLVFDSSRTGVFSLFVRAADSGGEGEPLTQSAYNEFDGSWSPDGTRVAFNRVHSETGYDLWTVRMDHDSRTVEPFLGTSFDERRARFSPDGRWLAYESDESGRFEIYVCSFPEGEGKRQVSTDGGTQPAWNPVGGELFYRAGDEMMSVPIETNRPLALGKPRILFQRPSPIKDAPEWGMDYDVSPDGERFLMIDDGGGVPPTTELVFVQNFDRELERLVPADP